MLFALIDILEKILAWLKPFSEKKNRNSENGANGTSGDSAVLESVSPYSAQTSDAQLIAALQRLMQDGARNPPPRVQGYLARLGGGPIFYGASANVRVWIEFHRDYGHLCDVYWKQ